jgi:SAM-dependent methyltransferase
MNMNGDFETMGPETVNRTAAGDDNMSLEEWWDFCQTDNPWYLTGSKGPEVWNYLNISDKIYPGQVVLNIGVGYGYCTEELVKRGCVVHALDISEIALNRVRKIVAGTWLPGRLADLPNNTFDLAISNLVTQHMADKELLEQMCVVTRSLKHSGIFAMQFAYRLDANYAPSQECLRDIKIGGVCRSLSKMNSLTKQSRGKIFWAKRIGRFPKNATGWYGVHIIKSDMLSSMVRQSSSEDMRETVETFNQDGVDLFNKGDFNGAEEAFHYSVELNPEFAIGHNNLGLLSCHRGQHEDAVRYFARALQLDPSNPTIIENIEKASALLKVDH